jgi:hypothetical protein
VSDPSTASTSTVEVVVAGVVAGTVTVGGKLVVAGGTGVMTVVAVADEGVVGGPRTMGACGCNEAALSSIGGWLSDAPMSGIMGGG